MTKERCLNFKYFTIYIYIYICWRFCCRRRLTFIPFNTSIISVGRWFYSYCAVKVARDEKLRDPLKSKVTREKPLIKALNTSDRIDRSSPKEIKKSRKKDQGGDRGEEIFVCPSWLTVCSPVGEREREREEGKKKGRERIDNGRLFFLVSTSFRIIIDSLEITNLIISRNSAR